MPRITIYDLRYEIKRLNPNWYLIKNHRCFTICNKLSETDSEIITHGSKRELMQFLYGYETGKTI